MTDLTVNIKKTIQAPIEKVFDAWLDPKMLSRFMMPMPGMPESDVENDAREGGKFTIVMHVGDDDLPHTGEYLKIDRPQKLIFTWESHRSIQNSTVTLNFEKIDEGNTRISLSHIRFIDEEARSDHEGGWANILDKLNEVFA